MSCSVEAIPILLIYAVSRLAAKSAAEKLQKQIHKNSELFTENAQNVVNSVTNSIVEEVFETNFVNKEILIKTMEEHGICNIQEDADGKITGILGTYRFLFEKESEELPYNLKITCNNGDNAEEKVDDISTEYAMNVQEAAYLNLVEKLKNSDMHIEDETVEEDNTIVLTINLE